MRTAGNCRHALDVNAMNYFRCERDYGLVLS